LINLKLKHSLNFINFPRREVIHCARHFSSRLPLAVEPASTPRPLIQKNFERFSTYWYAPFCCVCLGCCAVEFGSSGGTYE